jgi:hypothetical protein
VRRGLVWRTTKAWTQAHRRWLRSLTFDQAADQGVLNDYRLAVDQLEARLETVDAAPSSRWRRRSRSASRLRGCGASATSTR